MVETQAVHHVLARWGRDTDDLTRFFIGGRLPRTLNMRAVLVAESARGIEGMVVLFDSGHSFVYADHLRVCEGAPMDTGPKLILAVNAYCQANEKEAIFLGTDSIELAYMGKRRGGVIAHGFRIRYDITDKEGAKH